jgi:hypothetical protein
VDIEEATRVAQNVDDLLRRLLGERCAFVIAWARDGSHQVAFSTNVGRKTATFLATEIASRFEAGDTVNVPRRSPREDS